MEAALSQEFGQPLLDALLAAGFEGGFSTTSAAAHAGGGGEGGLQLPVPASGVDARAATAQLMRAAEAAAAAEVQ